MQARLLAFALALVGLSASHHALAIVAQPMDAFPHSLTDLTFSKADCDAALKVAFAVSDVLATDNLEVWVSDGGDCTLGTARSGATTTCYRLDGQSRSPIGQMGFQFSVDANEIASAGIPGLTACADDSQTRSVSVFLLLNVMGSGDVTNAATIPVTLDFNGPAAPTITSVGPSDSTSLEVAFTPVDGSGAQQFYVYCEQSTQITTTASTTSGSGGAGAASSQGFHTYGGVGGGGAGGAGGAGGSGGIAGAGGAGGGSSTGGTTSSTTTTTTTTGAGGGASAVGECGTPTTLVAGQVPTGASCGQRATTPVVTSSTLVPGYRYLIGVAGVDNVGNVGPLSALVCSAPSDVDDFWSDYLANGGQAGGGCSLTDVAHENALAVGGWMLVLAVALGRRRRESV